MTVNSTHEHSGFDGALRWIGDLDHPFYDDERQRFIWYEASAIGLQLTLMLQFLVSGTLMLIMGSDSYPFLAVGMVPVVVAATLVTLYAHRQGAPYFVKSSHLRSSRAIFGGLVVAVFVIGAIRILFENSPSGEGRDISTVVGGFVGAASVFVVGYFLKRKNEREQAQADANDF